MLKNLASVKIGKSLIWILVTTLTLIELYERLQKHYDIDGYIFILFLICVLLILIIAELLGRYNKYLNIRRF